MSDAVGALASVFDFVWARFTDRLEGLDDEEYLWEPVPGCWSLRPDADGRWRIDGGESASAPAPPPFTTIAWRIAHVGLTFIGFGDRLYSDGRITLNDVVLPASAAEVVGFLETCHRGWRTGTGGFAEDRWWSPIGPAFGGYARQSGVDLALHVLDEVVHHAAEVGVLRDLYPRRDRLT
jgi:hypothetical protein